MSTKPDVTLSRWADQAGSFVTDAPSGLRDTGFLDATPLEADIVNAELKQLYLWAKYLSDGALSGAHSISGGLSVSSGGISLSGGDFTVTTRIFMSGTASFAGSKIVQGNVAAASTGNNNNFLLPSTSYITITGTGTPVITGAVPAATGHIVTLVMSSTSASVQFTHEDTNSSAANRFHLPGGATLTVAASQMVTFIYGTDGTSRWLLMSKNF